MRRTSGEARARASVEGTVGEEAPDPEAGEEGASVHSSHNDRQLAATKPTSTMAIDEARAEELKSTLLKIVLTSS